MSYIYFSFSSLFLHPLSSSSLLSSTLSLSSFSQHWILYTILVFFFVFRKEIKHFPMFWFLFRFMYYLKQSIFPLHITFLFSYMGLDKPWNCLGINIKHFSNLIPSNQKHGINIPPSDNFLYWSCGLSLFYYFLLISHIPVLTSTLPQILELPLVCCSRLCRYDIFYWCCSCMLSVCCV